MLNNEKQTKVALITGAAKRIGAEVARTLHQIGFNVVIHYNHSRSDAEQLIENLNQLRENSAIGIQANLNSLEDIEKLAKAALNSFHRCDVLINNASSFFPTPINKATENEWDNLFSSNAKAPFFLSQALAKELTKNQGVIINIADIHAQRPLKNHTIYCMAKAANLMMTQSLALELAPHVRVNSISPGAILWPENKEGKLKENPEALNQIPLRRLGGSEAIIEAVTFLINSASYITGQNINIDGGRSLRQ